MIRIKKIILALLLVVCNIYSAFALDSTIKIHTVSFPPYGIINPEGYSGIFYDMANLITENAGYKTENTVIPYPRIIQAMKLGKTDLTIMFRYPSSEDEVTYIAALPPLDVVIIGLKGTAFESVNDLTDKKIIHIRGAALDPRIENNQSIFKYQTKDFLQCVRMLSAGKVDAIVGSLHPIKTAALILNESQNKEVLFGKPYVLSSKTPWLQISKKGALNNDVAIKKLEHSFNTLQNEGKFEPLRNKYLNK